MSTHVRRLSAAIALALVAAFLTAGAATSPAAAARTRLGSVLDLALTAQAAADGAGYRLTATWDAVPAAAAYAVKLTVGGATVDSGRTTAQSWGATVTGAAGTQASVTVTPVDGRRRGKPASASTLLPDVTPPTGGYGLAVHELTATITEVTLSDDLTPREGITRSVDWGDGGGFEPYPSGSVVEHTYAELGRYVPRVRMADSAGNVATLTLRAVVLGDTTGPTGSFTVSPQRAWTGFTPVTLTQVTVADDYTPPSLVTRTVDWGDGSVESWPTGPMQHVYEAAGTYPVRVLLIDEAGNQSPVFASTSVEVADDVVAPTVTPRKPKRKVRRVATWKVLRGTAKDAGTGVETVEVAVVQRRATGWRALKSRRWVRAASRKAAWTKASVRVAQVSDTGSYRLRVPRLRRGLLVFRTRATDAVGNRSGHVVRKQRLTRH